MAKISRQALRSRSRIGFDESVFELRLAPYLEALAAVRRFNLQRHEQRLRDSRGGSWRSTACRIVPRSSRDDGKCVSTAKQCCYATHAVQLGPHTSGSIRMSGHRRRTAARPQGRRHQHLVSGGQPHHLAPGGDEPQASCANCIGLGWTRSSAIACVAAQPVDRLERRLAARLEALAVHPFHLQ